MTKNSKSNLLAAFTAAALTAFIPITSPAQSTESTDDDPTEAAEVTQIGSYNKTQHGVLSQNGLLEIHSEPNNIEAEVKRHFNELRREQLDDWATTVTWWLAGLAIFLSLFSVAAGVIGFLGFRKLKEIRSETEQSAQEARRLVEEIRKNRDKSRELRQEMTAEAAAENPERVRQSVEDVRNDPAATPLDIAIADAISLQEDEKTEDAIEQWRAIAIIAKGSDDNLAARAWFSVGFLLPKEDSEKKISAYSRAIQLRPDLASAYFNRGLAMARLARYAEAITNYDDAIRLQPDYARAYFNRGISKRALGRSDEARSDYESALIFARETKNADLAARIERRLRELDTDESN